MRKAWIRVIGLTTILVAFSSIYWTPLPGAVNFAGIVLIIILVVRFMESSNVRSWDKDSSNGEGDA